MDMNFQIIKLVENAKKGDRAAMERLVDSFHDDIFRMVYYRTRSQMDAEDLTQEIFMKMLKKLPVLKDAGKFKPWLLSIALNRVKDFHRKKRILIFLGTTTQMDNDRQTPAKDGDNPEDSLMRKEFWKHFHRFARILSRREREVFLLRFVDYLGIREIAQVLKKNESTVKTHLYRAIKKFRQNEEFRDLFKGEL